MAADRKYTFQDGTEVELVTVSQLAYYGISTSEVGRPTPPLEDVVYAGGRKKKERNFNNPDFMAKDKAWTQARSARTMKFIIVKGVKTNPSDEVAEEYRQYLDPMADAEELKYLWVMDKLADEAEINRFMEAVTSQSMVTPEGLKESEAAFPGDGGQPTDPSVQLQETADGEDYPVAAV